MLIAWNHNTCGLRARRDNTYPVFQSEGLKYYKQPP